MFGLAPPCRSLAAQTSADAFAVIKGTAIDSIRGGYLAGAVVRVNGTSRGAVTDSLGRFRIDSVTAGSHELELIHPFLDTLGMALKTPPMPFRAGTNGSIRLSIPSAKTVVAVKCGAAERVKGPAALLGTVFEVDGDTPGVGATVTLEWTDLEPVAKGFQKVAQKRTGAVQADGSFRICGLPADLSANTVAIRGSDSTSVVGVEIAPLLAVVSLFLPPTTSGVSEAHAGGGLRGRIIGRNGVAIARARVAVDGGEAAAVSTDNGGFALAGVRPGTRVVSVRALGYQPVERVVTISSLAPRTLMIVLDEFVPVLKTVRVAAIRDVALERVGFTERQRDQPTGRFFTPEFIERRNPQKLVHLLETSFELRRARTADGKDYIRAARGCLRYFLDGVRLPPASEDDVLSSPDSYINAAELGAVEVYSRDNAPGAFAASDSTGAPCTVVLIWTKFRLGF